MMRPLLVLTLTIALINCRSPAAASDAESRPTNASDGYVEEAEESSPPVVDVPEFSPDAGVLSPALPVDGRPWWSRKPHAGPAFCNTENARTVYATPASTPTSTFLTAVRGSPRPLDRYQDDCFVRTDAGVWLQGRAYRRIPEVWAAVPVLHTRIQ